MLNCRILIIDDDPDDIDLLMSSFSEIGASGIHSVLSMQQAIEYLQSISTINNLPKLIITDLNMPGQNGYDLLNYLKANPRYKVIPVIIFSTSMSEKEINNCLSLGAMNYIPKPVLVADYIDFACKMNAKVPDR